MATMTQTQPRPQPAGRDGGPQSEAQPILRQRGKEIQPYGTLTSYPLGLRDETRAASVEALNQVLSDTIVLRDLYKKHHWQVSGPTFYALHLLLDKHHDEQDKLVDLLAERVQTLGGIAIAMAHDVAETTKIERPPRGREEVPVQLSRLLDAHEHILVETRAAARKAADMGDDGTNDLLVSEVVRTNELEVWFLSEHLVDTPLVRAK
jgi:starvation-inducible DNA-binding protein